MPRIKNASFTVSNSDSASDVLRDFISNALDGMDVEADDSNRFKFEVNVDDSDPDGSYLSGTIYINLLRNDIKAVSGKRTYQKGNHPNLLGMDARKLGTLLTKYIRSIPWSGGEVPYDTPSIQDRHPEYDAYMSGRYASKRKASRFELGQVVQTRGVAHAMRRDPAFAGEIMAAFNKYRRGDWGDTQSDSKRRNNAVLRGEEDQVFAVYNTSQGKVYIITEWDGSVTTILFANEY